MNRKALFVAALAALGVGAVLFMGQTPTASSPKIGSGVKSYEDGKAVVSVPTGLSTAPLIVFFGGTPSVSYANKRASAKVAPDSLKRRALILFVDTGSGSLASYVQQGRAIAAREGLTVAGVKALGFSAGGADVQNGFSPEFSFVGLIDPSTNVRYLNLPWNAGVRMIYNVANWAAKYESIKQAMPQIAAAINKAGGEAQVVPVSHRDMVPKFFAMYEEALAAPVGN